MEFQEITITPVFGPHGLIRHFELSVGCNPGTQKLWTEPGQYPSPEAAVNSFSPTLKRELASSVIENLRSGLPITFTLENAFDGFD